MPLLPAAPKHQACPNQRQAWPNVGTAGAAAQQLLLAPSSASTLVLMRKQVPDAEHSKGRAHLLPAPSSASTIVLMRLRTELKWKRCMICRGV